jgi:predicted RNA binding protein YcfA (HicA-like mRNA interferase family)
MRLPRISGLECVKALARAGFRPVHREGSHVVLRKDAPFGQVTVPLHRELDRGTLRAIIRGARLTVEEFREFLG